MASYFYLNLIGSEAVSEKVFRFLPHIFKDNNVNFQIARAQSQEIDFIDEAGLSNFLNCFIETTNEAGITRWENIFGIVADLNNDTLQFRRSRIINRLASTMPFTEIFLRRMLESVFGPGKWRMMVDPITLEMFIDVETTVEGLYQQTLRDVQQIVPANIFLDFVVSEAYMHRWLRQYHTYGSMKQWTYGDLSANA